jgi:hypothetical protein
MPASMLPVMMVIACGFSAGAVWVRAAEPGRAGLAATVSDHAGVVAKVQVK